MEKEAINFVNIWNSVYSKNNKLEYKGLYNGKNAKNFPIIKAGFYSKRMKKSIYYNSFQLKENIRNFSKRIPKKKPIIIKPEEIKELIKKIRLNNSLIKEAYKKEYFIDLILKGINEQLSASLRTGGHYLKINLLEIIEDQENFLLSKNLEIYFSRREVKEIEYKKSRHIN